MALRMMALRSALSTTIVTRRRCAQALATPYIRSGAVRAQATAASAPALKETPKEIFRKDYKLPPFTVTTVDLRFNLGVLLFFSVFCVKSFAYILIRRPPDR